MLIEKYPENLITEDSGGSLPLLHAFWNNAPCEVVQLFVERHRTLFPAHVLDWVGMVDTVGRAYAPGRSSAALACVKTMLSTQKKAFPDHYIDWQKAVTEWASQDTHRASDREAQKFHHLAFKELVIFSISDRVNSLSVKKWRHEILGIAERLPWFVFYRQKSTEMIYSKLSHYEHMDQMKEAASVMELALWKDRINLMLNDENKEMGSCRKQPDVHACRIRCGADIVVPNVLRFLALS
jgi:hypothetical protein